jgi:hypothetical protein
MKLSLSFVRRKKVVSLRNMCHLSQHMFTCCACMGETDVYQFRGNIERSKQRVSGRLIDYVLSELARTYQLIYYVDTFGGSGVVSLEYREGLLPVDLVVVYRRFLSFFSKFYFDCFGRGTVVVGRSGSSVGVCLSQTVFYLWAKHYRVVQYIELLMYCANECSLIKKNLKERIKRYLDRTSQLRAPPAEDIEITTVNFPIPIVPSTRSVLCSSNMVRLGVTADMIRRRYTPCCLVPWVNYANGDSVYLPVPTRP